MSTKLWIYVPDALARYIHKQVEKKGMTISAWTTKVILAMLKQTNPKDYAEVIDNLGKHTTRRPSTKKQSTKQSTNKKQSTTRDTTRDTTVVDDEEEDDNDDAMDLSPYLK